MMMLSSKDPKRLSQAIPETYPISDGPVSTALFNNIQPPNYGLISAGSSGSRNQPPPPPPAAPAIKDAHLRKLMEMTTTEDGNGGMPNSHSLNHDFSQLYISKLKNQVLHHGAQTSVAKRIDGNHQHAIEEISSYKKEALACKKQMFQMEKSITFWNDCTEYWRNKWRRTRDEKNKLNDQVKQLRSRVSKLEHQLQMSDEKRIRLGDEVTLLNEELSRYMYRFDDDQQQQHPTSTSNQNTPIANRVRPPPGPAHFNSDRRVDYRKKHRRKKSGIELAPRMAAESSTSETDSLRGELLANPPPPPHSYTMIPMAALRDDSGPSGSGSGSLGKLAHSKIALRHHERLFDKKIMNRKRFSQVVMLDEEEMFQLNKEIPSTLTLRSDADTLKVHPDISEASGKPPQSQRYMDYVPEEDDVPEEDEEDYNSGRIKRGMFFAQDIPTSEQQQQQNHEDLDDKPETEDDDEV